MTSRREFLKRSALAAGATLLPARVGAQLLLSGMLPPASIPKYVMPLVIPPAMPQTANPAAQGADYYEIAVRQFQQQILPPGWPLTTVWSYGSHEHPQTFHYPAFTIEARHAQPLRVKWANELVDSNGDYLPHLLPVDPTLHWANPPGGEAMRDMRPSYLFTPGPYLGPVPIVTHVHGAHTTQDSDGYPEAWYLPQATNIPSGYARVGTWYETFKSEFEGRYPFHHWDQGTAVFEYGNDQRATTLWYHDHTLGMTRLNVYAGPAGFYLLRGGGADLPAGMLPGPAPGVGDPLGTRYYEIPIVIQDRSFCSDGSLFYPDSREFFDGYSGPYIPHTDLSPIWNPEFFGNTMVVNGRTWPLLEVEPRRYRLRFLNGCNSRFLILKIVSGRWLNRKRPGRAEMPFWQIGSDGGFLAKRAELDSLLMAPAERADVIVDFSEFSVGTELYLINEGPDEPFGGGRPDHDFDAADPATTGQVMKFRVVPLASEDTSTPPQRLSLPAVGSLGSPSQTRRLSLNENMSMYFDGPAAALLGTVEGNLAVPRLWMDEITENPALGATEVWELYNLTEDAHPIHIHLVQFQVLDRQGAHGKPRSPEPWETGHKDTVIAYPGEVTRLKARFDKTGLFVWHCHIVEHEDNEMMRPYRVGS